MADAISAQSGTEALVATVGPVAGSVVEVTGTLSTRGGVSGINVTGAKLAAAK